MLEGNCTANVGKLVGKGVKLKRVCVPFTHCRVVSFLGSFHVPLNERDRRNVLCSAGGEPTLCVVCERSPELKIIRTLHESAIMKRRSRWYSNPEAPPTGANAFYISVRGDYH